MTDTMEDSKISVAPALLAPMKHLTLLALGSRGDVQPLIALGLRLVANGHLVRLVAAADYEPLVAAYGLHFVPAGGYIRDVLRPDAIFDAFDSAANPLGFGLRFLRELDPLVTRILADCAAAAADTDALIVTTLGQFVGDMLAEQLGIPCHIVHMHPQSVTRAWPSMFFPSLPDWAPARGSYNRLTHWLGEHGFWQLLHVSLERARTAVFGVPPRNRIASARRVHQRDRHVLYAYSPYLAPSPPDWSNEMIVTGYWWLPDPPGWQPPPELLTFLAAGPTPIYIGFGSILAGRDPNGVTAMLVRALHMTGQRGIIYRGWGDLGNITLPSDVLVVDAVPHTWLFERVAAVVHHGGAGTTAAGLRAGRPTVTVPFFGDQRFWGARVAALDAGPQPIPRQALTAERLAAALRQATEDPVILKGAADAALYLASEQGVTRALAALGMD